MIPYNFNQHKHNYALWTAARAVQRGFTTTGNIKIAIEKSDLRQFSEDTSSCSSEQFERFHRMCSHQLISAFSEINLPDVSYGRAAKIISIYLKTSVVLSNKGECDRSNIIHPPIDSILLNNMSNIEGLKYLKTIRWTQLDENGYWELINKIKSHFKKLDWTLEEFWTPELDN